jgi:hypothetical protein
VAKHNGSHQARRHPPGLFETVRRLPRIMAGLRNLTIGVHRQDGHTIIATALRHTGRDRQRPLTALGMA